MGHEGGAEPGVHKCTHILVSVLPDPTHGDGDGSPPHSSTHQVPHPHPEAYAVRRLFFNTRDVQHPLWTSTCLRPA
jgi:hypothetical protein